MAKQEYTGNLVETKGEFRIRGIIAGKDNPTKNNGFREGKTKGEDQKPYKSIRFLVKTAEDNTIPVELFGMVQDFAFAYNNSTKEKLKLNWKERFNSLPDGFKLIEPSYDLVDKIHNDYKDGDSVVIIGEIDYSEYTDNTGTTSLQRKYIIKRIMPSTEPVDFADEKFEEENRFKQTLAVREVTHDTQENKLHIYAYIIGYGGKFNPAEFEIDANTADKQFVRNMKGLKFGDVLTVNGKIQYRAIGEVVKENDGWGTNYKTTTNYWKALEITGADGDSLETKKYKESDFEATSQNKNAKDVLRQIEQAQSNDDIPFDLDN
jgi:single-stranded DNA-binding protein